MFLSSFCVSQQIQVAVLYLFSWAIPSSQNVWNFLPFSPTLPKQLSICNLVPEAFPLPSHFIIIDAFYQLSQSSFTFGQNWLVMKNNKPRGFEPVRYRKNDICKKLGSICQIVIRKSLWISIDITCQELKIPLTALVR